MKHLKKGKVRQASEMLSTAYNLLKQENLPFSEKLWGVTLNNLGCYYKKIGKSGEALKYLERCLEL